jgi:hypothetical protein
MERPTMALGLVTNNIINTIDMEIYLDGIDYDVDTDEPEAYVVSADVQEHLSIPAHISYDGVLLLPVVSIDQWAFCDRDDLLSVEIQEGGIKKIDKNTFMDCYRLRTVRLPHGLKVIGQEAFSDCINLETLYIPSTVEFIGRYAFSGCDKLREVIVDDTIHYRTDREGEHAYIGMKNDQIEVTFIE